MTNVTLVDICFLQFGLSACIDSRSDEGISLEVIKEALKRDNFFEWMKSRNLPGCSIFIGDRDDGGRVLTQMLRDEDNSFESRERRKLGVEKNGICYLLSLTIELVQSLQWQDDRKVQ
jgi:hypothetical protein